MYLRHCKDKKKNKPKSSRCREIITIKAELNEVEVKKKIQEVHWPFGNINKIGKLLAN